MSSELAGKNNVTVKKGPRTTADVQPTRKVLQVTPKK